ncbi:MAG: N-6 DNA methylase [Bacteroidota bacterium]
MSEAIIDIELKKHLGQYFSGHKVAKLLAYLCKSNLAKSIIDPMCGSGDMLSACTFNNSNTRFYDGIEIDARVAQLAQQNLSATRNVNITNRNSFDLEVIKRLANTTYDLVITNPPYVRYQSFSNSNLTEPNHLSSNDIRNNLIESLGNFRHISQSEKETALEIIKNYSGLSDMAVPSWILCSLLVSQGGRLGIVVPNTWLNRNYADIIQYLLQKWFRIEYIIEDGNSTWFPTAQVKTTLLIAKRIPQKPTILDFKEETFTYCTLYSTASSNESLVGSIFPDSENPEQAFAEIIENGGLQSKHYRLRTIKLNEFSNNLHTRIKKSTWYHKLDGKKHHKAEVNLKVKIPSELSTWLGSQPNEFTLLEDYGVNVSQGLRTGANSFFYIQKERENEISYTLRPDKVHPLSELTVLKRFCKDVLRRQSELDNSFSIDNVNLSNILIYLQDAVLERDFDNSSRFFPSYDFVEGDLEKYIEDAENLNIGKDDEPKFYPELSAVKPNIRKVNPSDPSVLPRFWYMIPQLTKRHQPELFVPRVNGQLPKTRLNRIEPVVIDANFSSLWITETKSGLNKHSALALLNSTWCVVAMEEYGTVMGGGALKLEATHIKKIPIPKFDSKSIKRLTDLGIELIKASKSYDSIIQRIDSVVIASLSIEGDLKEKANELRNIKNKLFKQRNG